MPPHRVGLLHRFGLKTDKHFAYLGLESPQSGMVFEGTTGMYDRIQLFQAKVVGKSARDNPEGCCGWFWVHCFSKNFQRIAREAMDVLLRVLKERNKSRFDSYSVKNKCIDHIPYYLSGLSSAQFFRQPFSKQLYNLSFQFQMSQPRSQGPLLLGPNCEFEMDLKNFSCLRLII